MRFPFFYWKKWRGREGKFSEYNQEWNSIGLFYNPEELAKFIEYSKQDSVSLLNVLLSARAKYLEAYNVDITRIVSTPSLSLLIFRHRFLDVAIPILNRVLDAKIRGSYFGGSSDYNYLRGVFLKYYDVNSLSSFAMLNDMPLNFVKEEKGVNINLDEVFGFVHCIVTCPKDIPNPLLLHNFNGRIIHPTGTWEGTYFSEELKAAIKYGYKIHILKVFHFSRHPDLFTKYINHFYEIKKEATMNKDAAKKAIAKLHLNSLYGMFGRGLVDFKLIKQTNSELSLDLLEQKLNFVKTNVAIASAIASYARIEMMKYKTLPGVIVYYTDTDSIFINKELPSHLVGDKLGQMKDELDGGELLRLIF